MVRAVQLASKRIDSAVRKYLGNVPAFLFSEHFFIVPVPRLSHLEKEGRFEEEAKKTNPKKKHTINRRAHTPVDRKWLYTLLHSTGVGENS